MESRPETITLEVILAGTEGKLGFTLLALAPGSTYAMPTCQSSMKEEIEDGTCQY